MLRNLFNRKTDNLSEEQQIKVEESATESSESEAAPEDQRNWYSRLKAGLAKTRNNIVGQISGLLRVGRTIDEELMEEIEEILIQADVGVNTTLELMDNVREVVREKGAQRCVRIGRDSQAGDVECTRRRRSHQCR